LKNNNILASRKGIAGASDFNELAQSGTLNRLADLAASCTECPTSIEPQIATNYPALDVSGGKSATAALHAVSG
jgi:hypothetical protein